MKKQFSFVILFLLIGISLSIVTLSITYSNLENKLKIETIDYLSNVANKNAEEINDYLFKMDNDIEYLQESNEIKNMLKQQQNIDYSAIKIDVNNKARIIKREIENYILTFPEMTLSDLQNNLGFRDIAVQPIGMNGYSAIYGKNDFEIYFHEKEEFIGTSVKKYFVDSPQLLNLIELAKINENGSEGFYYLRESNGELNEKYGKFINIPLKTYDGVEFSLAVTSYSQDYKSIDTTSKYLDEFNLEKNYNNIVLISPEGQIIYMNHDESILGTNLQWPMNLQSGLAKNYLEVKKSKQFSFYGPFVEEYGNIYPKFSVIAPVYDSDKLLGYVGLIKDMKEIFVILNSVDYLYKTEEYYLVNEEKLLISPLRNEDFDIMTQHIFTENSYECSESVRQEKNSLNIFEFLDYRGEIVFGGHIPINKINWCVLSEVDKKEVLSIPLKEAIKKKAYIVVAIIIFFSLIEFFIGRYVDKTLSKQKLKLKKNKNLQYSSKFMNTANRLFSSLRLNSLFLISLLFSLIYFLILNLLFSGFSNINFYDLLPDSLAIIAFMFLLLYSFKLKKIFVKKMIFIGALLSVIDRMIQMILEEYIFYNNFISTVWWIPGALFGFIGLIFILFGFEEGIE